MCLKCACVLVCVLCAEAQDSDDTKLCVYSATQIDLVYQFRKQKLVLSCLVLQINLPKWCDEVNGVINDNGNDMQSASNTDKDGKSQTKRDKYVLKLKYVKNMSSRCFCFVFQIRFKYEGSKKSLVGKLSFACHLLVSPKRI